MTYYVLGSILDDDVIGCLCILKISQSFTYFLILFTSSLPEPKT